MKTIKITKEVFEKKLHFLPFNRKYSVREELVTSMNKFGFAVPITLIETDLIDGVNKLWIADGQNRLAAAMYLKIQAVGVISPIKFKDKEDIVLFVAKLNSEQKPWSPQNYAEVFAYLGNPHYHKLLKVKHRTPYTISTIAGLLHGIRSKISGAVGEKIKKGEFKVNHLENTEYVLSLAAELSKYERLTSRMILALGALTGLTIFNESRFKSNYIKNAKKVKELKLDDYSEIFTSWVK